MRTLVDIPEKDLDALDQLGALKGRSRAAIIREAIASYLSDYRQAAGADAFGIWKKRKIDALDHQRKLRDEW